MLDSGSSGTYGERSYSILSTFEYSKSLPRHHAAQRLHLNRNRLVRLGLPLLRVDPDDPLIQQRVEQRGRVIGRRSGGRLVIARLRSRLVA